MQELINNFKKRVMLYFIERRNKKERKPLLQIAVFSGSIRRVK
jgi:hypothetical protein